MHRTDGFPSPVVSCEWLLKNRHKKELVVLDASVYSESESLARKIISEAKYVDIKRKLSDSNGEFPNTFPSQVQFEIEVRKLGINNESLIVVYDNKGVYWSPRVWWLFKSFGHQNVAVLDGGLPEWQRLGFETTFYREHQLNQHGNFTANYQADKMRFFYHINEISKNEDAIILDARSEDRFKSIIPEPRAGLRSGTIPNSENLPYTSLFDGHCLRPKEDLKTIFSAFNIGSRKLTFSCGSGITACILALAAEIVGIKNLSVYDGSWTEYGTLTK
ncbi:sulfurtransferase [uncultured Psychroserpens sp.]|uniref:sulfurtransferase n=1 Tax=uncultured Psychroserpens sp. TaxID=255436 RepID=UPI0026100793|nr:sulfurtransferase [uncultured Psychroserpens sp.]